MATTRIGLLQCQEFPHPLAAPRGHPPKWGEGELVTELQYFSEDIKYSLPSPHLGEGPGVRDFIHTRDSCYPSGKLRNIDDRSNQVLERAE